MEDFRIFETGGTDIWTPIPFYFSHEFHNKYFKEYDIADGIQIQTCLAIPMRGRDSKMLVNSLREFEVIEWSRGEMNDDRITFGCVVRSVRPEVHFRTCVNMDTDTITSIKNKIIFISKREWKD